MAFIEACVASQRSGGWVDVARDEPAERACRRARGRCARRAALAGGADQIESLRSFSGSWINAFCRPGGAPYSPAGGFVSIREKIGASPHRLSKTTVTCVAGDRAEREARLPELGVERLQHAGRDEVALRAAAGEREVVDAGTGRRPRRRSDHRGQADELAPEEVVGAGARHALDGERDPAAGHADMLQEEVARELVGDLGADRLQRLAVGRPAPDALRQRGVEVDLLAGRPIDALDGPRRQRVLGDDHAGGGETHRQLLDLGLALHEEVGALLRAVGRRLPTRCGSRTP